MKKLYLLVISLVVLGLVVGSFSCAAPKPVPTTPAEVSFEGKTITLVVPMSPGAGTDITARLYARYLPRYLPGKPTVIVRNMLGGAGTIGSNYVYSAKPDGLTMLISSASVSLNQLVGMKAVHYDLLKMPVTIAVASGHVWYIKSGIISKPEDLPKAKGLVYGSSTGFGAYSFICVKELLGIPTEKAVLAYAGSADARRAFLSGEVNFCAESSSSYRGSVAPYVERGEIMLLFQSGLPDEKGDLVKVPAFPHETPTIKELYERIYGKSPSGMAYEALKGVIAAALMYQWGLHLPPGTPDSIVRAYWDATDKMLKDPELRKIADTMLGEGARLIAGEACDKGFKLNFGMKPEVREWFRATLPKYGIVVE